MEGANRQGFMQGIYISIPLFRWHLANGGTRPKLAKFIFGCIPATVPVTASALPSQPFTLKKINNDLNPIP